MRRAILHLKKSDPILRAIIERVGPFRMEYGEPTFHSLAEAIVYQQLNGKAAVTIFKRFTEAAGNPLTPAGILKLSAAQMRAVGLHIRVRCECVELQCWRQYLRARFIHRRRRPASHLLYGGAAPAQATVNPTHS